MTWQHRPVNRELTPSIVKMCQAKARCHQLPRVWHFIFCALLLAGASGFAKPQIRTDDPTAFFTNVASRLLKSELNVDLNRILLYPTNQYTPAVHRLLQLTANLYDCVTNRPVSDYPYLPSVFRPLITRETTSNGTEVFISGFTEVTNAADVSDQAVAWRSVLDMAQGAAITPKDMVYGVPLVVGAKTGLPNFNGFEMETAVRIVRGLEFRRPSSGEQVNETNQMLTLSISNVFGLAAWNSYSNAYPRPLEMRATVDMIATVTNEFGEVLLSNSVTRVTDPPLMIGAGNWPGWINPLYAQPSFRVPFQYPDNSFLFLSNSIYRFSNHQFASATGAVFERLPPEKRFGVPRWWLTLQTRVRYSLVDVGVSPNRLVDFTNLEGTPDVFDITSLIMVDGACGYTYTANGGSGSMWCTNRIGGEDESKPTFGILNQIGVGLDQIWPYDWLDFERWFLLGLDPHGAIDFFRAQFSFAPHYYPGTFFQKTNVFYAPFAPVRQLYLRLAWEANDPLVHYTVPDLTAFSDYFPTNRLSFRSNWITNTIGSINKRYEPWGGNRFNASSPTRMDPSCKDPLITRPSDWIFPTNQALAAGWLGLVHRGTPWQTLYLKAVAINNPTWLKWIGALDPLAAAQMHPTRDWSVVSLLAALFGATDESQLVSVNQAGAPDFAAAMDGFIAWTNAGAVVMEPLLISSNSPQAAIISTAIKQTQMNMPQGRFNQLGEVCATLELSFASPYLGYSYPPWPLNDQGYEAIASQLLPRLRTDPILTPIDQDGSRHLRLTGIEGSDYALQASSNLLDWVSISTNTLSNGSLEWPLPTAPSQEPRFFRAARVLP